PRYATCCSRLATMRSSIPAMDQRQPSAASERAIRSSWQRSAEALATARLTTLATAWLKASRDVVSGPVHFHLDASNAEPIAGRDGRLPNSFVVDVSPVRAREFDDFEGIVARRNPAVQAGNERDVEDEIGSRRAADGLDRARRQSERRFRTLQNPHGRLS